jgi:radical SAM/Cys-rich protein
MKSCHSFQKTLANHGLELKRDPVGTVQVNIGRRCNQACHHCHVESGPNRTENMNESVIDQVIRLLHASPGIHTVDITGGAPELNPNFRRLVIEARKMNRKVIDRCNLTVFFEEGQEGTPEFLRDHGVHIVASLPCYSKDNVEKQRGRGVFGKSIEALKMLNALGYGRGEGNLSLDLVYNPTGPSLPPSQGKLEADYKKELKELFDIEFNHLFTITNMPIKRFLVDVERAGKLEAYMDLLANAFNPTAAENVMCKTLVSVSWDGRLFDCDFNQMLDLPLGYRDIGVWDLSSFDELNGKGISVANHCFACAAGAGSSCGGALT